MIEKAYVVPHPPIILPEIGRGEEEKISATISSMRQVAAEIEELKPDTVILSSPHAPYYRDGFYIAGGERVSGDFSQFGFPGLRMNLTLDSELSDEISRLAEEERIPHVLSPDNSQLDHGAMVPLRFVEQDYPELRLVLLGLSALSARDHYRLGMCIQKAVQTLGRRAVFIASGDFSHVLKEDGPYGFREEGPVFDEQVMDILARAAFDELLVVPPEFSEKASDCGLPSFQIMAGALDGQKVEAERLSYEGPFGVGYGVLTFTPKGEALERQYIKQEIPDPEEALPYIELARASIRHYLEHGKPMEVPEALPQRFYETKAGCFVTLHQYGQLRGCIGTMQAVRDSLAEEIIHNAISAANSDPRFPQLRKEELDEIDVSVDVLGDLERINSLTDLDPQRYGVYVMSGRKSGVLLPRLEGVNTVEEQVGIAMSKAGITLDEEIDLYRFEVLRYE